MELKSLRITVLAVEESCSWYSSVLSVMMFAVCSGSSFGVASRLLTLEDDAEVSEVSGPPIETSSTLEVLMAHPHAPSQEQTEFFSSDLLALKRN